MAVVQAQPVFSSPYEPGREAMRAVEFGQGLRARQDALTRDNEEYNRQRQVRELLGSGKPEAAKGLMTLQERAQLVNMQGSLLNQQRTQLELDAKEQALNSVSGGLSRLSQLRPEDPDFEKNQADALIGLAPLAAMDPDIARSAQMVAETQTSQYKRHKEKTAGTLEYYQKQADLNLAQAQGWDAQSLVQFKAKGEEALARLWQINSMNIPTTEKLTELQKWDGEFNDIMRGPTGKTLQEAKGKLFDQLIDIERVSKTRASDKTEFERSIDEGVAQGWLTPEEAIEKKKKRQDVFTTPRSNDSSDMEKLIMALSGKTAATTASPSLSTPPPAAPRPAALPNVSSKAQFDALPPDSRFIGPDGKVYYKPEARQSDKSLSDLVTGG